MNRSLPLLLLLLLCSACIQLGGEPQPNRFYLLESVADSEPGDPLRNLQLELGPFEFPTYLDRPQIVSRDQNNSIIIADHDRWAEPLPDNLARTLKENLLKQLAGVSISTAPWTSSSDRAYSVKLSINRFDGIVGRQTDVDIRWSLSAPGDSSAVLKKHFVARLPVNDSYKGLVKGLSMSLAMLSKEIAAAVSAHAD